MLLRLVSVIPAILATDPIDNLDTGIATMRLTESFDDPGTSESTPSTTDSDDLDIEQVISRLRAEISATWEEIQKASSNNTSEEDISALLERYEALNDKLAETTRAASALLENGSTQIDEAPSAKMVARRRSGNW